MAPITPHTARIPMRITLLFVLALCLSFVHANGDMNRRLDVQERTGSEWAKGDGGEVKPSGTAQDGDSWNSGENGTNWGATGAPTPTPEEDASADTNEASESGKTKVWLWPVICSVVVMFAIFMFFHLRQRRKIKEQAEALSQAPPVSNDSNETAQTTQPTSEVTNHTTTGTSSIPYATVVVVDESRVDESAAVDKAVYTEASSPKGVQNYSPSAPPAI